MKTNYNTKCFDETAVSIGGGANGIKWAFTTRCQFDVDVMKWIKENFTGDYIFATYHNETIALVVYEESDAIAFKTKYRVV